MSDSVKQLTEALKDQPANPLRNHQVEDYKHEASRLQQIVNAPAYVTGVDRGLASKAYRNVQKQLDTQAAKQLTGEKKDRVAKLAAEVMNDVIRPALLPTEEMRRNPAGSVGKFLRQENSPAIQDSIQQWKRAQLALESDNADPDLANVERFRPTVHTPGQAATFMAGAQIPGQFAMTPQAKENWPLGEAKVETAIGQVKKREMSEKQLAALASARAKRAASKEGRIG